MGVGGLRPQFGWGEGTQGSVLGYVGVHNSVLWSVGDSRLNLREVLMFVGLSQGKASTTEMFSPFDAMNTNFHKYRFFLVKSKESATSFIHSIKCFLKSCILILGMTLKK